MDRAEVQLLTDRETWHGNDTYSVALCLMACRAALPVRFFTAAEPISQLEKERRQYTLDRFLRQLNRDHPLIIAWLGYVTMSRGGVELFFRVFGDRHGRGSLLVTSNLPFSEWSRSFLGERMTAALLDRLTDHCLIPEMNGESDRFREAMKCRKAE